MTINKKIILRKTALENDFETQQAVCNNYTDTGNVRSLLRSSKLRKKWRRGRKCFQGVCILPLFTVRFPRGWGVNNVNSDSGFPRGRGDTKSAVIRGRGWIFFGISHYSLMKAKSAISDGSRSCKEATIHQNQHKQLHTTRVCGVPNLTQFDSDIFF